MELFEDPIIKDPNNSNLNMGAFLSVEACQFENGYEGQCDLESGVGAKPKYYPGPGGLVTLGTVDLLEYFV